MLTVPDEQLYNYLTSFFDRAGTWFLTKSTLAEFVCNRRLPDTGVIQIGMIDMDAPIFLDRCGKFQFQKITSQGDQMQFQVCGVTVIVDLYHPSRKGSYACNEDRIYKEWLLCPKEVQDKYKHKNIFTQEGMCKLNINEVLPYYFPIPYLTGRVLDVQWPLWFKEVVHREQVESYDTFFDAPRKQSGYELLGQMLDAAEEAGIREWTYPGFGTMLGAVREGDFILNDRDLDLCFCADHISVEQMEKYYEACDKRKLFEYRKIIPTRRDDNNKFLWFSLGSKNPFTESGCKSCQWFEFEWEDWMCHSKGGLWVSDDKFRQREVGYLMSDQAICKGFPAEPYKAGFTTMNFHGIEINIPQKAGTILDSLYPIWGIPRTGKSSAHTNLLVISDWNRKETWRMV
jgi:hypothetical protein